MTPSGRKAAYGDLVQAAAGLAPPQDPRLKPAANFKLIGQAAQAARHARQGEWQGRLRH